VWAFPLRNSASVCIWFFFSFSYFIVSSFTLGLLSFPAPVSQVPPLFFFQNPNELPLRLLFKKDFLEFKSPETFFFVPSMYFCRSHEALGSTSRHFSSYDCSLSSFLCGSLALFSSRFFFIPVFFNALKFLMFFLIPSSPRHRCPNSLVSSFFFC